MLGNLQVGGWVWVGRVVVRLGRGGRCIMLIHRCEKRQQREVTNCEYRVDGVGGQGGSRSTRGPRPDAVQL